MPEHTGEYIIRAPREDVFKYMDDPKNAVKATPNIKNANVIKNNEDNRKIEAQYSIGNIIQGKISLVEEQNVKNEFIKFTIKGDIEGYVQWEFKDTEELNTIFSYKSSYDVKNVKAPRFLVQKVASRIDKKNMKSFIRNLRSELE
jgi:carbon monoxide dehydrogenase subunit G